MIISALWIMTCGRFIECNVKQFKRKVKANQIQEYGLSLEAGLDNFPMLSSSDPVLGEWDMNMQLIDNLVTIV